MNKDKQAKTMPRKNKQSSSWPIVILIVVAVGVGMIFGYFIWNQPNDSTLEINSVNQNASNSNNQVNQNLNANQNTNSNANVNSGNAAELSDMIKLTSPLANDIVTSPILGSGQARGSWFFEASFPVRLEGADGRILAITQAQAVGDWMTNEFVPFTFTLPFTYTATTQSYWLVLAKDNPSGQAGNNQSLRVLVRTLNPIR